MLQLVAENSSCSIDEVAECILNVLFYKFENAFADVAIKKNIVLDQSQKQMDIISTEAMLSEARIGT